MDPMNKVVELEKRIMNLEKKLERKQTEAISPIRLFGEAIASLLFGIFIIGPLITGVCALVVYELHEFIKTEKRTLVPLERLCYTLLR